MMKIIKEEKIIIIRLSEKQKKRRKIRDLEESGGIAKTKKNAKHVLFVESAKVVEERPNAVAFLFLDPFEGLGPDDIWG